MFRGTPLFAAFQRRSLEAELEVAKQDLRIAQLERELADVKRQGQGVRLANLEDELGLMPEPQSNEEKIQQQKEKRNVQ